MSRYQALLNEFDTKFDALTQEEQRKLLAECGFRFVGEKSASRQAGVRKANRRGVAGLRSAYRYRSRDKVVATKK